MFVIGNFEIVEKVCASTPDGKHMLIMQVILKDSDRTVWVVGDDWACAVTTEDCVRNKDIDYNSVLLKEFPYIENTPQSVGEWRPLIEELVKNTISKYLEHDGRIRLFPQWLPEEGLTMEKDLFDQACVGCDHIILHGNNIIDFVPKRSERDA